MPNGIRRDILHGPESGRSEVIDTSPDLQLGPIPERVDRLQSDNDRGVTGRNTDSFPGTWDQAFIPHQPTIRGQANIFTAPRTIADDAAIPATYAGNPLP